MTEAHLKTAYDRLRELNIGFDEKYILIEVMSTLSSKSFNEGYDKAIETAKRVYEKVQNTNNNSINAGIFCNCIKCLKHIYKMKKIIDKFLIKRSIRPYKTIALSTGVIVEHYRNGKLKTEYYGLV